VNFHDNAYAMAVQRDGHIVLAGATPVFHDGFNYNPVAVARFTADGAIDTTFGGGDGVVILDPFFGAAADVLTTIALDQSGNPGADGRIVIGGHTFGRNCAFLARIAANGAVDTTFGSNGRVVLSAAHTGGAQTGISVLCQRVRRSDVRIARFPATSRPARSSPSRSARDVAFPFQITLLESRPGRDAVPPVPGDQVRGVAKSAC
jgi:uncharacterized delta-60 repeat protein